MSKTYLEKQNNPPVYNIPNTFDAPHYVGYYKWVVDDGDDYAIPAGQTGYVTPRK